MLTTRKVLDRLTTKDVLKALLHSILFHRLFGTIKPQTIDILGVTMVPTHSVFDKRDLAYLLYSLVSKMKLR